MGLFDGFGAPIANAIGSYLQNVLSGQMAAQAVPKDYYDPNRSFAQNALDPNALGQAANIGLGFSGGGLGIKAYHGSPYDFNAFEASKIGTGEGAQAYGHGLYFAESEPVAQSYRSDLANQITLDNQPFFAGGKKVGTTGNAYVDDLLLAHRGDVGGALASEQIHADGLQPWQRERNGVDQAIEMLKSLQGRVTTTPGGKMYEVNINAEPSQFLDWDKPLSQQSPRVQQAIGQVMEPYKNEIIAKRQALDEQLRSRGQSSPFGPDNPAGAFDPFKSVGDSVPRLMDQMATPQSGSGYNPAAVSQTLQQGGIPGIRYLDQGSRGAGQGTSNYVVFDPSIIDIVRKYGLAGLMGGAGAAAPYYQPAQQ